MVSFLFRSINCLFFFAGLMYYAGGVPHPTAKDSTQLSLPRLTPNMPFPLLLEQGLFSPGPIL